MEGQETAWIEVEEKVEEEVKRGREEGRGRGGCVKCGMRWEMTSFFSSATLQKRHKLP